MEGIIRVLFNDALPDAEIVCLASKRCEDDLCAIGMNLKGSRHEGFLV